MNCNCLCLSLCIIQYFSALYACLKNLETVDESTAIIGLITHFLAECPSKPLTIAGDPANNGAVWMPYYDASGNNSYAFSLKKGIFDTNIFPEQYQCIDSTWNSSTKANWASGTWVWYDTCPLGKTYFPVVGMSWENPADVATMQGMGFYYSNPVSLPWSGRGVCKSDGTWVCRSGFLSPNWEIHWSEAGTW